MGVTLHHIAEALRAEPAVGGRHVEGDGVDDTAEVIDRANAAHAARAAAATPTETASLLLESGALLEAALRGVQRRRARHPGVLRAGGRRPLPDG